MNENISTESLQAIAARINGKRKDRIITNSDITRFQDLFNAHENDDAAYSIRVYSEHGFVPNSYKWRAEISYLSATRTSAGWQISGSTCDAKRSHGNGALSTVNSRSA